MERPLQLLQNVIALLHYFVQYRKHPYDTINLSFVQLLIVWVCLCILVIKIFGNTQIIIIYNKTFGPKYLLEKLFAPVEIDDVFFPLSLKRQLRWQEDIFLTFPFAYKRTSIKTAYWYPHCFKKKYNVFLRLHPCVFLLNISISSFIDINRHYLKCKQILSRNY